MNSKEIVKVVKDVRELCKIAAKEKSTPVAGETSVGQHLHEACKHLESALGKALLKENLGE